MYYIYHIPGKKIGCTKNPNEGTGRMKGKHVAPIPVSMYRQEIDKNHLRQREGASAILDTRSPMPLYDRRILPQRELIGSNENHNDPLYGDAINLPSYDPIAVAPINSAR